MSSSTMIFAMPVRVLHRPAVGDVAEVLDLDLDVETLCPGLVFGESDAGDLRVGEHRRRHVAVVGRHQRVGVVPVLQQVVPHDARLVVGDVLELVVRRHVTERENAARRGALVLVDDHLAVRRHLRRRPAPRRAGRRWASGPVATSSMSPRTVEPSWHRQLDAVAVRRASRDFVVVADRPLLGRDVGEAHRDVVVVTAQQRAAPDHQRHAAAQRREDVRELACDEAAADDDQVLGHVGDPHDGVAGVIGAHRIR